MNPFILFVVASASIATFIVVLVQPRASGDLERVPAPAPAPVPGTCARFTPDPSKFMYTEYYVNTCQENITEAQCVPESEGQLVTWSQSVPCTDGFLMFSGYSYYQDTYTDLIEIPEPFYRCCPEGLMLLYERKNTFDTYVPSVGVRRVCVNVTEGKDEFPPEVYSTYSLNATWTIKVLTTDDSGLTCAVALPGPIAIGPQSGTGLTTLEIINSIPYCQTCQLVPSGGPASSECVPQECTVPQWTKTPFRGACVRYTPHPSIPGYINTCERKVVEECQSSGTPGELFYWADETKKFMCQQGTEYTGTPIPGLQFWPACPTGHFLFHRTLGSEVTYMCIDPETIRTPFDVAGATFRYYCLGYTVGSYPYSSSPSYTIDRVFDGTVGLQDPHTCDIRQIDSPFIPDPAFIQVLTDMTSDDTPIYPVGFVIAGYTGR